MSDASHDSPVRRFWDQLISANAALPRDQQLPYAAAWLGNDTGSPYHGYGEYNFRQQGHLLGRDRVLFMSASGDVIEYGERSSQKDKFGAERAVCHQNHFGYGDEFRIVSSGTRLVVHAKQYESLGTGRFSSSSRTCGIDDSDIPVILRNLNAARPRPVDLCGGLQPLDETKPRPQAGFWSRLFGS